MNKFLDNPFLAGAFSSCLLFWPLVMPMLFPLQLLAPLPLILTQTRVGGMAGWMGLLVVAASAPFYGLHENVGQGLLLLLFLVLMFYGLAVPAANLMRSGWTVTACSGLAFMVGAAVLVALLAILPLLGVDLGQAIYQYLMSHIKPPLQEALQQTPGADAVAIADAMAYLDRWIEVMALLMPAALISGWFFILVGNLTLARNLLIRWQAPFLAPEAMAQLRLPFILVWLLIVPAGVALIASGWVRYLAINLAVFAALPYFFQGLAVVQAGFRAYGIIPLVRGFFYVTLVFVEELTLLVTVLGLFDTWLDFRTRYPQSREGNEPSGR